MTRSPVVLSAPAKNGTIRVGSQFQVAIPEFIEDKTLAMEDVHEATCVFSIDLAEAMLTEEELDNLITAGRTYNFDPGQSLLLLHLKKYNIRRTLSMFTLYGPFPQIWDPEDLKMFTDGLAQYGKDFLKVQEFLPHKTRRELVEYYYNMKKKIHFKTPHRKKRSKTSLGEDDDDGEDEDEDSDSSSDESDSGSERECNSDEDDFSPTSTPPYDVGSPKAFRNLMMKATAYDRRKRRNYLNDDNVIGVSDEIGMLSPPSKYRGIPADFHLDKDEFKSFMNQSETAVNTALKRVTQEYEKAKNEDLQLDKKIDKLVPAAVESVVNSRPDPDLFTPTAHWSPREIMLILVTFERFGTDCENAASIIGTKTVEQVEEYRELMMEKLHNFDELFGKSE